MPDIAAESMAVDVEKPTAAVDAGKTTADDKRENRLRSVEADRQGFCCDHWTIWC